MQDIKTCERFTAAPITKQLQESMWMKAGGGISRPTTRTNAATNGAWQQGGSKAAVLTFNTSPHSHCHEAWTTLKHAFG